MAVARGTIVAFLLGFTVASQTCAKGTGFVFVSNAGMNTIAVIDPEHGDQGVRWIQTCRRPRDMAFRNDRRQLLVSCGDDNEIDAIDIATMAVTDHIPTGVDPEAFELSPDQKTLYVPNKQASVVQEIDVDAGIIEHEIRTGADPGGLALSGDGRTLYVTSETSDWVHVVDVASGVVMKNIAVGTRPRGLLLMAGGRELWVSNQVSADVSIVDRASNRLTAHLDFLPPGAPPTDVTPVEMTATRRADVAFVTLGRANCVAFVDTSTRKIRRYVPVGQGAGGLALSADEKTLYVANALSDDVSIVDVAASRVVRAVPVGRSPHAVLVDD